MLIKVFLSIGMMIFASAVFAEIPSDVYSATVPVENQTESQRQLVLPVALHQVVDQLTIDSVIKQNEDVEELYQQADKYVESFSYVSPQNELAVEANPESSNELMIQINFDRDALMQFFMQHHMMQSYSFNVQISGITSAQNLNALMTYLNQFNSVQSANIVDVYGDKVTVALVSLSDQSVWLQKIIADQHLFLINMNASQGSVILLKWKNA